MLKMQEKINQEESKKERKKERKKDMKRIICVVLTSICIAALMTGCGEKTTAGTVSTDGSTSMEKAINTLGESFMNQNSGVTFT